MGKVLPMAAYKLPAGNIGQEESRVAGDSEPSE